MTSLASLVLAAVTLWAASDPDSLARWLEPRLEQPSVSWVRIPAGRFSPTLAAGDDEPQVPVAEVLMAETPTTNAEFLWFVSEHPEWRRGRVSRLFADARYLEHWAGSTALGSAGPNEPVTDVSWFAAKAYCASLGARLPTDAEWQRAAAASHDAPDARRDPAWSARILRWYAEPSSGPGRDVGQRPANYFGVKDLHGLVWEWVLDFNSTLVTSDSRSPRPNDQLAFCGAGALSGRDPADYASFMRAALLGSLRASSVTRHLGFRCARDGKETR